MPDTAEVSAASAEIHPVQVISRFLRIVWYRKGVVIVALTVSTLLGALYYFTAKRIYESRASLLVLQIGTDTWSTGMSGERQAHDLMPTYRNMLTSEAVLQEAAKVLPPEHRADLGDAQRGSWVGILQNNLTVNAVRDTNILEIIYRSKDPHAAAGVVDAILSAYLAFMDKLHKSTAGELLDILTREKVELEKQLRKKEAELVAVRNRAGEVVIRDGSHGVNVTVKRAISLNQSLIVALEKRLDAQSQLATIENAVRNGEELQLYALEMAAAVGREVMLQRLGLSTTDAHTISRIKQQLLDDRAKLQSQLQRYGPANRRVREIQERIQAAENYLQNWSSSENLQLQKMNNRQLAPLLLQMARQQLQQAVAHENSVLASYQEEKQAAIQLDHTVTKLEILELDLNRLRGFYDVVLQRVKDIDLGQENGMLRTSILRHPTVQLGPISPRKSRVALLSLVVGLGLGLVIVYLQDLLDDHFRSPEELRMQLGVPVLAMIRKLDPIAEQGIEAVHVHLLPNAVETEAFRTLRTALALAEDGLQRLVVSSSEPGDGKTTVVANLATAYAQSGKRTLLIDADLRRPGLTSLLGLRGERGLSTILREGGPVAEIAKANLRSSIAENLDVLPSGPRPANPTELLAGDRLSELISWAEANYDQILIDSPPALVSDTAIIGRLVDGVLLTVQPEKNRRRVTIRAVEGFSTLGIKVIGIVVNRITVEKNGDYYGYGYGYEQEDNPSDVSPEPEESTYPPSTIVRRAA